MDKFFDQLLPLLPKFHIPVWASWLLTVVFVIWGGSYVTSQIVKFWKDDILPRFYNADEKRRSMRRHRFASLVEYQIRQVNNSDDWQDYRFAELEAEVEVDDRSSPFRLRKLMSRTQNGVRRERSLSKALISTKAKTLLLEGDPGAGKSVALRHVAQAMAQQALKKKTTHSLIPLYIDLKFLERRSDEAIDAGLIDRYVREQLARSNDREADAFLEDEFQRGMDDSTWFFVIDSFDEIPEVLGSISSADFVKKYAVALSDFLGGMNQCRSIVASRKFNGPEYTDWTRVSILPLSEDRRYELIKRAELPRLKEHDLVRRIGSSNNTFNNFAANPLFLSLLCEYMRGQKPFPNSVHEIFEAYIETRLNRDSEKLRRRFGIEPSELSRAAELIGFTIAYHPNLSLSPTRDDLNDAMGIDGTSLGAAFEASLDALEFIKVAQAPFVGQTGKKHFAFIHRRFQEYFATRLVLQEPDRVASLDLMTNGRWRETAVATFQIQPLESLTGLIDTARSLICQSWETVQHSVPRHSLHSSDPKTEADPPVVSPFPWPQNLLYMIGILQEGFINRLSDLPDELSDLVSKVIVTGYSNGSILDKKLAVEHAGILPRQDLLSLLTLALSERSQWLMETAYRQIALFGQLPPSLAGSIREVLVRLALSGQLYRQKQSTKAYLAGIDASSRLIRTFHLLLCAPFVDSVIALVSPVIVWVVKWGPGVTTFQREFVISSILLHYTLSLYQRRNNSDSGLKARRGLKERMTSSSMIRVMFPISFFTLAGPLMMMPSTLFFFYAACVTWLPAAYYTSLEGDFVHPCWWPFLQVVPFLRGLLSLKRLLDHEGRREIFDTTKMIVLPIAQMLAWTVVVGACLFVLYVLGKWVPWDRVPDITLIRHALTLVGHVLVYIMLFVGCLMVLAIVFAFVSVHWGEVSEKIKLSKWSKASKEKLSTQGLADVIVSYRNPDAATSVLREIRHKRLLEPLEETKTFLFHFASDIQQAQRFRREEYTNDAIRAKLAELSQHRVAHDAWYEKWLNEYQSKDSTGLSWLSEDFVDELFKLIEQIEKEAFVQTPSALPLTEEKTKLLSRPERADLLQKNSHVG